MRLTMLDCDGVAANFTGTLLRDIGSELTEDDIKQWDLFDMLAEDERKAAYKRCEDPEFWLSIDPYPEALTGVKKLIKHGDEIVWVTSPWVACREWEHARRKWLYTHFDAKSYQVIPAHSKRKHLVRGDVFIDDRADVVERYRLYNPTACAWLYHRPHNASAVTTVPRFTWHDLETTMTPDCLMAKYP